MAITPIIVWIVLMINQRKLRLANQLSGQRLLIISGIKSQNGNHQKKSNTKPSRKRKTDMLCSGAAGLVINVV